jgi:hypothetical protein
MARIIFGNMVADARGKVGGIVYSRNTGGAYARQKVSPVQPRTPAQLNQRSRLTSISKLWENLTNAQREAWKAFSLAARKRDVLGLSKQRTAQQMFMFCNLALDSAGYATISNPPVTLEVDALSSITLASGTSGTVQSVSVTTSGTGYTSPPTVSFTGGGGSGAAATALLIPTSVASFTVVNGGSGYTSAPTVTLVGGGGVGATATATVGASGTVTAVTVVDPGGEYTSLPSVVFSGGGGTGASATAVMTATGVGLVTVTAAGSNYASFPTVVFTGGGGAYAAGLAVLTLSTSSLVLSYTPGTIPQSYEAIELWMTSPYSAGKTFVKNLYRYCALLQVADVSPQDVTTAWTSVFGALPIATPYKISARARIINSLSGARSEWAVSTLLVTTG